MYRTLGRLNEVIAEVPGGTEFFQSLDGLDLGFLGQIHLQNWGVRDTPSGLHIELAMAFEGEVILKIPGLDLLSFVLGANVPGYTFISGAALIGSLSKLDLYNLQFNLRLEQDFLTPVALNLEEEVPDLFEVQLNGSFSVDTALNIEPRFESFTIPPFGVGQTGLVLSLEDCQLDLNNTRSATEILNLGYDADFKGVYAKSAQLYWLPQAVFDGLPGLRLDFSDVALGQTGVSFHIERNWQVEYNQGGFLSATELKGCLFSEDWQLALAKVKGSVRQNIPSQFFATGFLEVPLLDTIFASEFGLQSHTDGSYESMLSIFKPADVSTAQITIGAGSLTVNQFALNGTLAKDSFDLTGVFQGSLDLPGFAIDVEMANMALYHSEIKDEFKLELAGVEFGPIGEVETATLYYKSAINTLTEEKSHSLLLATKISWEDLHERLNLDELPEQFPLPPDDAEITAYLSWDDAPSTKVILRFSADVSDLDSLWGFLPAAYRPEVRDFVFTFDAEYNDVVEFKNGSTDNSFQGRFSAAMQVRLPTLPSIHELNFFTIDSGDDEGWLEAKLVTGTRPDSLSSGAQEPYLDLEIANLISVDFCFPGMIQPHPPIHTAITRVGLDISAGTSAEGKFIMSGGFCVRPIYPPSNLPFAPQLQQLMAPLQVSDLAGTINFELAFKGDKAAIALDCNFSDTEIEFDIFEVINNLAQGMGAASEGSELIPLDLDVGFKFKKVRIELGSLDDSNEQHALFELGLAFSVGGMSVDSSFYLSDKEFSLSIAEMRIPLEIPAFPLSPADLEQIKPSTPTNALWDSGLWESHLGELRNSISTLEREALPEKNRRSLREFGGKLFLLENLKGIYELMSSSTNKHQFQIYTETLVGAFDGVTSVLHFESSIELVLEEIKINIPFENPKALGLSGKASLDGFADDDPFEAIEGRPMTLGISADQFYFELESLGDHIPLPDFGRYPGGSVNLSRLRIGYAYTRNALSINFAGALVLPPQLVEDADTSDVIGAGIRLPTHNALNFRLDLIPVVLGAVDFIVPMFEFDIDLRKPNSPAFVSTSQCEPYWDGLQMIVPGVYHDSLKHLAFSPLFAMCIIPNFRFDGALKLGDDKNGLTVIADDMLVLLGYFAGVPVPIPFFASPAEPYFENLCVNLRVAGFGVNFNLQRPFPSMSPLALFEVLGLLADPMMKIDPDGSLANTVRVALTDGSLTIPPQIRKMFPELSERLDKPMNIVLNLGTFISSTQHLISVLDDVARQLQESGSDVQQRLRMLSENPPALEMAQLLNMVPPELRKIRVSGAFAGFEATAVLVIVDATDKNKLKAAMQQRGTAPPLVTSSELTLGSDADPNIVRNYRPNLTNVSGYARELRTDDPNNNLFLGMEFKSFSESDIDDLPEPRKNMSGVIAGAHVKVFAGQRFRFLGCIYEDGSFGMISALDIEPLMLDVAGVSVSFPLSIHGRMQLQGRAKRDGVVGNLIAEGYGEWEAIPGVLKVLAGSDAEPIRLKLNSDGRFYLHGTGELNLFRGAANLINGSVEISHTHCMVAGDFHYSVGGVIDLSLDCRGRVGPGDRFELAGGGHLKVLGHSLSNVEGRISESGATVSALMNLNSWNIGAQALACTLRCRLTGEINLRRHERPEFRFEGDGSFAVFGAMIEGRGGIRQTRNDTQLFMSGALSWQGHRWLEGRIAVGSNGVRLGGHLGFGLALSPSNLNGIDLAHLFINVELDADFTLDATASMGGYSISGRWTLGARLPSSGQIVPLAAHSFGDQGVTDLALPIINISGFSMLPFNDITIPVPKLTVGSTVTILRFDVPLGYELEFDGNNGININVPFDASFDLALVWRSGEKKLAIKVHRDNNVDQFVNLENASG